MTGFKLITNYGRQKRFLVYALLLGLIVSASPTLAQNISLDHPVKCGKLQCFPSADVESEFYYLPSNPHVTLNDDGTPEFSFTRYVNSSAESTGDGGGIQEADGGGIVHFLIDYTVPDKQLQKARAALQEINEDAILRGPIIFTEGNFALVSSFAPDEDKPSDLTKHLVGVGRAPLIEGLKAAVSIHLTKLGAQILWRSFQMRTPDVSLVFEMTFSGLNDPADATITANWNKLQNQADVTMGAKVGYLGIGAEFDYGNFWEKAEQSGAINIEYKGDPDKLQSIVDRAYARLHDMMFEPIQVNEPSAGSDDDPLSALSTVLSQAQNSSGANYSAPWEVKISGGYRRRKITRSGNYKFNFRQRSNSSLTTAMAGNIGSLYLTHGDDPTIFRTVNLTDEEFRIREVSVSLDARDEQEFTKYINHVTFSLKKQHGSGETSTGELTIKRSNFESGRPLKISYNWDNDPSVEEWMNYQYKADWSFVGGAHFSSGWLSSDHAAISLTPPYQYREIEFVSSPDILEQENVRLVSVRVKHDFFGREVKETINLIPGREQYNATRIFAVPPGKDDIEYSITWSLRDKRKITSGPLSTDETIIFCDELPPAT